jgi:NHLM bacteriocin system ABC transporter peptidase/ATP-binding protein
MSAAEISPPHKRVKTPTLLQMEAVECGAAALGIVLRYYGKYVPLEELRIATGVSRDGSKANNLIKAAKEYGLNAKGLKKEIADLYQLPLPVIVFWNFNHFLVIEGYSKDHVLLNDPAFGPRRVTHEEFNDAYTGIVLTFSPTEAFQKGGGRSSLMSIVRSRLSGSSGALALIIVAGLALVIPGIAIPVFSKIFVDDVLMKGLSRWIWPLIIGMGITAVLRALLTWLQESYLLRMETKLAVKYSSEFFWHVLQLPVEFFTQRFGGDIGSRVTINDTIAQLMSRELASNVINLVQVVFYFIVMMDYDVWLSLIGLFIVLLNMVIIRIIARVHTDASLRMMQNRGKLIATGIGGIQMIETLKATSVESDFFAKWSGYQAKSINSAQQMSLLSKVMNIVPGFLTALNTAIILGLGGLRVMDGTMSVGMLVAFQSLMASFTDPFNRLVGLGTTLQEIKGDFNRLEDVLSYRPDPQVVGASNHEELQQSNVPSRLEGYLELQNITFGYSRLDPPLIKDFSLSLKPGARVALIGSSGSGKSTVARLVSGLYQPWSGEILFDGKRREEITREVFNNSVAVVDQDIFMFEGSIRDNLALWDETIDDQRMVQGAKDARIHEDIAARMGGYDSEVNEAGSNFSGGQRQRIEIARALIRNPEILVLDEATSALDPITEKEIDEAIRKRGCTCLIVAHRLSTIRDCDEIIVLQHGEVVERGMHDELLRRGGAYAALIHAE